MSEENNYKKSSISNPIAFFEHFFPKGYLQQYHSVLSMELKEVLVETDIGYDLNIGEPHKFYSEKITSPEKMQELVFDSFTNHIESFIDREINISIRYTRESLLRRDSNSAKKGLIHTLFLKFAKIIDDVGTSLLYKKQTLTYQSVLINYIREIEQEYPKLITYSNSSYQKYLSKTAKKDSQVYSLKMSAPQLLKIGILLKGLKEHGFVEDKLSVHSFRKAFDGSQLEEPLNIKWVKIVNKECNFASILKLVELLVEKGYIQKSNNSHELYRKLSHLFVKNDGSFINNWKQAKYRKTSNKFGKKTSLDELEKIIHSF